MEEEKQKAQQPEKPDDYTEREWAAVPDSMKQQVADGSISMDKRELQHHVKRMEEQGHYD